MLNKCYSELKSQLNTPKKLLNSLPFNLVLEHDYNYTTSTVLELFWDAWYVTRVMFVVV